MFDVHKELAFPFFSFKLSLMALRKFLKNAICTDGRVASSSLVGIIPFRSVWNTYTSFVDDGSLCVCVLCRGSTIMET